MLTTRGFSKGSTRKISSLFTVLILLFSLIFSMPLNALAYGFSQPEIRIIDDDIDGVYYYRESGSDRLEFSVSNLPTGLNLGVKFGYFDGSTFTPTNVINDGFVLEGEEESGVYRFSTPIETNDLNSIDDNDPGYNPVAIRIGEIIEEEDIQPITGYDKDSDDDYDFIDLPLSDPEDEKPFVLVNISLPSFLNGADTTDLSEEEDLKAINNFTIHVNNLVKVVFDDQINLLSDFEAFKEMPTNIDADEIGKIGIKTSVLNFLASKGATITMYNLPYSSTPDIEAYDDNGQRLNLNDVNLEIESYDSNSGQLVFSVDHFSTYQTKAKQTTTSSTSSSTTTNKETVAEIDPKKDASVKNNQGTFKLNIPAGSMATENPKVKITITELESNSVNQQISKTSVPEGFGAVLKAFEFKAEAIDANGKKTLISSFEKPIIFEVSLTAEELKSISDPNKVGLFKLNPDGTLTFIGGKLIDGKIVVEMSGFSKYVFSEVKPYFADLTNHWAKNDVELLASKYIVTSSVAGNFNPEQKMTRAQFASQLVRTLGIKRLSSFKTGFKDINLDTTYCCDIIAGENYGLFKGDKSGKFKPNELITREQAAIMIARALKISKKTSATLSEERTASLISNFKDSNKISSWAKSDFALAIQEGIIKGTSESKLKPSFEATKAEVAVMLARLWRK